MVPAESALLLMDFSMRQRDPAHICHDMELASQFIHFIQYLGAGVATTYADRSNNADSCQVEDIVAR